MLPSLHVARILSLSKRISVAASRCYRMEQFNSSGAVKNPQTLHYKFVKYLLDSASLRYNNDCAASMLSSPLTIEDKYGEKRLNSTTAVQLALIVEQIEGLKQVNDLVETSVRLHAIDRQVYRILERLSLDDILLVLNKLVEVVPYKILGLRIYRKSFAIARRMLEQSSLQSSQIVNLLFLVSMAKTDASKDVKFFLYRLRTDFKDLPFMEQCIVSVCTFKAGVKLNKKTILAVEDVLFDKLEILAKDPGLIVSLIKVLRLAGPSPEFSLNRMSARIRELDERLVISTAVPVLGLYAEILNAEMHVVRKLVSDSIEDLSRKDYDAIRIKDVDRMLWATATLCYKMNRKQINEVEDFIDHKIMHYENDPKRFVNTILYLWILRSSKSRQRVEHCFRNKIFQPLLKAPEDDQQRLNLLIECVRIEAPEVKIPQEFENKVEEKSYKSSKEVDTICKLIECLSEHLDVEEIRIDCPVKAIRFYGISAKHRTLGKIHIDLLNCVTCLKNTRKPVGLMRLKLRLLKPLGYRSIVVQNDEVSGGIESLIANIERRIQSTLEKQENDGERYPRLVADVGDK